MRKLDIVLTTLLVATSAFLVLAAVSLASGQEPRVTKDSGYHVVRYNTRSHPQYYQSVIQYPYRSGSYWHPKEHTHHAGGDYRTQRLSNPNTQFPWYDPGGLDKVRRRSARINRTVRIPEGEKISVFVERMESRFEDAATRPVYRWTFPVGTIVEETITFQGLEGPSVIERKREKLAADKWSEADEDFVGDPPPGYKPVKVSCISCHNDAGAHVSKLRGHFAGRNWYGHARGNDTVFTFRPVTTSGKIQPWLNGIAEFK